LIRNHLSETFRIGEEIEYSIQRHGWMQSMEPGPFDFIFADGDGTMADSPSAGLNSNPVPLSLCMESNDGTSKKAIGTNRRRYIR
jgi:hypothetical protein